jgi:hypothetical protein
MEHVTRNSHAHHHLDRGNFETNIAFLEKTGFLVPGHAVLEIGSGNGRMVRTLLDRGMQALGTEINETYIANARNVFGVELLHMDGERIDVPSGSLDLVVSFDVLEHIETRRPLCAANAQQTHEHPVRNHQGTESHQVPGVSRLPTDCLVPAETVCRQQIFAYVLLYSRGQRAFPEQNPDLPRTIRSLDSARHQSGPLSPISPHQLLRGGDKALGEKRPHELFSFSVRVDPVDVAHFPKPGQLSARESMNGEFQLLYRLVFCQRSLQMSCQESVLETKGFESLPGDSSTMESFDLAEHSLSHPCRYPLINSSVEFFSRESNAEEEDGEVRDTPSLLCNETPPGLLGHLERTDDTSGVLQIDDARGCRISFLQQCNEL